MNSTKGIQDMGGAREEDYDILVRHSEMTLRLHGDSHLGAGWPKPEDRLTRFDVMLDVMLARPASPVVFCDLACGTGELLKRIETRGIKYIDYVGVDRSETALEHARHKFPHGRFLDLDVNDPAADLAAIDCDYLVANGLFTARWEMSHDAMEAFFEMTVRRVWPHVRRGIAFNVMSKIVDWERDDLFHVPMDQTARLLHELAGRHVMIRADYGLYEYTAYAFRQNPRLDLLGA